ncbi:MAG: site-specific integrase [Dehalococcoidales bacterium]|nr:site-specific integrase [Dehalococcoidales bacterium]
MSSIYKRKSDNVWTYIANLPSDKPGKRNRKSFYAPKDMTDSEAKKYLKAIKIETEYHIKHNIYRDPGNATIKDLLDEYIVHHKKIADTTKALHKMYVDIHLKSIWYVKAKEALPVTFEDLYYDLMNDGRQTKGGKIIKISPNTIIKIHSFLHGTFNFAVKNKVLLYNPMDQVDCPDKIDFEPRIPSDNEFVNLLSAVKGTFDEVAIVLAGVISLCRGEILGLKWIDIDETNQKIKVEETYTRFNENIRKDPKARSRKRAVYAPQFVFDILNKYKSGLKEPGDYVCSEYTPGAYSHHFKDLADKHKLQGVTLHKLRHYNAVIMMNLGIPDKVAAGRGGWSQVKTLQEVYQHITDDADKIACEKINQFFTVPKQ